MLAPQHNCTPYLTYDPSRHEIICAKCGIVIEDETLKSQFYTDLIDIAENPNATARFTVDDHNAGNGLFDSITPQADYVSEGNHGVALDLNDTKNGRDHQGKKIKRQLVDPYKVGNVVGKGMVMREDRLTGESELKFSLYEKPYYNMVRERANTELTRYGLSTTEKSIVAIFLKQICSRLAFSEMLDYYWMAATLNSGVLKSAEAAELEKQMYDVIGALRFKLLSRCDPKLMKAMKEEEEKAMHQEPESEPENIKAQ